MQSIELVLIGVSLILATAVVKLVEGIYQAAISKSSYWIPVVLMACTLVYAVNFLWSFNNDLDKAAQNYPNFVLSIMVSAVLFLRAHILVGTDPARIPDWRVHYESIARQYFIVAALLSLMSIFVLVEDGSSSGFDAASAPFLFGIALQLVGAIFKQTWVRGTVALISWLLVMVAGYVLFTQDML
jgi:hypothetical protein